MRFHLLCYRLWTNSRDWSTSTKFDTMPSSYKIILLSVCALLPAVSSTVKPECQSNGLTNNVTHTYLTVMCSMRLIYPRGNCSIAHRLQDRLSSDSANIIFSNLIVLQPVGSTPMECLWTVVLNGVNPGLLQIQATVTMNNVPIYSDWTTVANLANPTVSIATNCPFGTSVRRGYILAGTTASCRCEVTEAGNPPGFAQWYTESGAKIGSNMNDGSAILDLNISSSGKSYFCQPVSILNAVNLQRIPFTSQFAVGPTSLTIDITDANPLCPGQNLMYQVTCKVPATEISPRPLFTIIVENDVVFANKKGTHEVAANKHYMSYTFRPDYGGVLRVYCKVVNEMFPELTRNRERQLILEDPPRVAPVLECLNCPMSPGNNIIYLADGSDVHLKCSIDGGYPPVSNVTIICGTLSSTEQGTVASLLIEKPNLVNKILCRCSAWHLSGCYNLRSELILALKGSDEVPITPNNQSMSGPDPNISTLTVGLAAGLGCVGLILIVAVAVVLIYFKRRGRRDMAYNQPDSNSYASDQYASFVQGNTNPPQLPPSRQASDGHYDTIPVDMAQTLLKVSDYNLKHQGMPSAFRDSEVPDGYEQPI